MSTETQTRPQQQTQTPRGAAPLAARQEGRQEQQPPPAPDLRSYLNDRRQAIADLCGKVLDADRVIKLALLAASKTPALKNCDLPSVLMSILDLAKLGLEPDGRQAALIPYKGKCTPQVMYQGWVELLFRSNQVKDIQTHLVYEGDTFKFSLGEEPRIVHEPGDSDDREQRAWSHVYCVIRTVNGGVIREVMSKGTVMRIKASSQSASNPESPWNKWETEQARKTVFKRASKWAPKTPAVRDAMDMDDADVIDGEVVQQQQVKGVGRLRQLASAGSKPVDPLPPQAEDPAPADSDPPHGCIAPECQSFGAQHPKVKHAFVCQLHRLTDGENDLKIVREWLKEYQAQRRGKPAPAAAPEKTREQLDAEQAAEEEARAARQG